MMIPFLTDELTDRECSVVCSDTFFAGPRAVEYSAANFELYLRKLKACPHAAGTF